VVLGEANDYQRPAAGVQHELRVSNSRFITSISLAESVDDARQYIGAMRKTFRDANHHAYAFIVGYGASVTEGMSDDGEPSGTAGPPTLAVLRGAAIGDVVLVTTRYFGGTKLGTGGLVRAYTDAAKAGLALLKTERRTTSVILELAVPYALLERVRRLNSAYGAEVLEEHFAENVTVHIRLDEDRWPAFTAAVMEASAGQVQPVRFAQQSD
jgi:uncharacterized YigZ family protein